MHFYEGAGHHSKSATIKHFRLQGISKSTLQKIVGRYVSEGRVTHMKVGRKCAKKWTAKVIGMVRKKFERSPNISDREVARQLQMPVSSVNYIKVTILGINAHKKVTAPKYEVGQEKRAKKGCRKLYRKLLLSGGEKIVVMDDETYVPADPGDITGSEYYHCANKDDIPVETTVKSKRKFIQKKFLVWQAMDELGNVSEPYISTGTMDAKTYLTECLEKRLLPFIMRHHNIGDVVFWPDMATSHYARPVIEWLKAKGINFVERRDNAPNVPQARPIGKYWAACKAEYKRRKNVAKSLSSFKRIWRNLSQKVAQKCGKNLMQSMRRKLRLVAYHGVYSAL